MLEYLERNPNPQSLIEVYDSLIKIINKLKKDDHLNEKDKRRIIMKYYEKLQITSVLGLP